MRGFKIGSAVLGLSLGISTFASATTINFDPSTGGGDLPSPLSAMSNSPGSAVPTTAQLSNQYNATDGVSFSSTDPFVAVVNVGGSSASSPNGIGGVATGGLLSYADPITFTFDLPGTATPAVTPDISITADDNGIPGQFATLTAFDASGNQIDSETLNDLGGETWSLIVPGIHSALFVFPTTSTGGPATTSQFGEGTGIELDNLTFGTLSAASTPVSSVPLPAATWPTIILLGGLLGVKKLRALAH